MPSTLTVLVETGVKKRLEKLAKSTGRSRSFCNMNIARSPEAIEDLSSLRAHIAENVPAAARRLQPILQRDRRHGDLIPHLGNGSTHGLSKGTRAF